MEDGDEVEMEPADGFQRMLAHGLSEYHGLTTLSRVSPSPPADPASGPASAKYVVMLSRTDKCSGHNAEKSKEEKAAKSARVTSFFVRREHSSRGLIEMQMGPFMMQER